MRYEIQALKKQLKQMAALKHDIENDGFVVPLEGRAKEINIEGINDVMNLLDYAIGFLEVRAGEE